MSESDEVRFFWYASTGCLLWLIKTDPASPLLVTPGYWPALAAIMIFICGLLQRMSARRRAPFIRLAAESLANAPVHWASSSTLSAIRPEIVGTDYLWLGVILTALANLVIVWVSAYLPEAHRLPRQKICPVDSTKPCA
ncbi:MAG TPA: hypothetical protein VHA30_02535 [Patescibacteria group bacterium]|nr:hypothetical protein [Patescibacteria group bacterium]